jgi:small subunit ribosomal protein S17e
VGHDKAYKWIFRKDIMGRIKTKMIKRTSRELVAAEESFNKDFDKNKKMLGSSLPSKRMRNKIAGYVSRLKRQEKKLVKTE